MSSFALLFTTFPDIVSAESYWQGAFSNSFRFIGYPTKEIQRDNISYIIDPFCTESITFFNAIQECTYKSLYANEIRFLQSIEC